MKKVLFVLAFAIFGTVGLMAQNEVKKCTKSESAKCCASKKASATAAENISVDMTKVMAVSMKRQNVTKRQCAETGAVSYFQKEVCEKSGKVSYNEVQFDAESRQFVNVSPNDIGDANTGEVIKVLNVEKAAEGETAKKACSKKESAKCCASKKAKKSN